MTRLRSDDGSALIVAILVAAMMLALGLPAMAFVDVQQRASGNQRISDSAYNLAEGLLETHIYMLSRSWPGSTATAGPPVCVSTVVAPRCPAPAQITASFTSPDWAAGAGWTTTVSDNGGAGATFYSDALAAGQPTWDANGDGRLWVRSHATAKGRKRTIVALVQVQTVDLSLAFPDNVITAGWLQTTNKGKKVIVDTQGSSAQPAPVAVRCPARTLACLGYEAGKSQISPDTTRPGYAGGAALSAEQLDSLRARAIAAGSYYASGCPANPTGAIVFVESGNCNYTNSAGPCCNSAAAPGVLVIANGSLSLGGNINFHGVLYLANLQNSPLPVLTLAGTSGVVGAVAVDGPGGVLAGASGRNITYASGVRNRLVGYGAAGIIQNTWRELAG